MKYFLRRLKVSLLWLSLIISYLKDISKMASNNKNNEKRTPEIVESPSKRCKNKPPIPAVIVKFFIYIILNYFLLIYFN